MGCLAGPVTVCVVGMPPNVTLLAGVRDSKKMSEEQRNAVAPQIVKLAEEHGYFGIGWASPGYIDEHGIAEAWQKAASDALARAPDGMELVIDGTRPVKSYTYIQRTEVKADDKYWTVAAASVVAKTVRDLGMLDMGREYPAYGWARNAGYGTEEHRRAVLQYGPCDYHRMRYLKKMVQKENPFWGDQYRHWASRNK